MFVKINHECAMLTLVYALLMFIYTRFIIVYAMSVVVRAKEKLVLCNVIELEKDVTIFDIFKLVVHVIIM